VEIVYEMEMCLPKSLFGIKVHLILQLIEEVELTNVVATRRMFVLEQYMKEIK